MLDHYLLQFLSPKYFSLQNLLDPEMYNKTISIYTISTL
jgi:hypothetical protein